MSAATNTTAPVAAAPPQLSDAELAAWRGLLRTHASLVRTLDIELERAHALPLSSYEVLLFLDNADEHRMRMCELAESVLLSRSGLTRLVDRLEREGLVQRESCDTDARGAYAALTAAGAAKLRVARATHFAGIREHFLAHFTEAELETLGSFWERATPGATASGGDACGSC